MRAGDGVVDTDLPGIADVVIVADRAQGTPSLVVEDGVVQAGADIGAAARGRKEVVLQGQGGGSSQTLPRSRPLEASTSCLVVAAISSSAIFGGQEVRSVHFRNIGVAEVERSIQWPVPPAVLMSPRSVGTTPMPRRRMLMSPAAFGLKVTSSALAGAGVPAANRAAVRQKRHKRHARNETFLKLHRFRIF